MGRISNGSTTPSDNELCTLRIELRGIGLVDGEQFMADEVVARLQVGGDFTCPLQGLGEDNC